jgi:hypothetical protein
VNRFYCATAHAFGAKLHAIQPVLLRHSREAKRLAVPPPGTLAAPTDERKPPAGILLPAAADTGGNGKAAAGDSEETSAPPPPAAEPPTGIPPTAEAVGGGGGGGMGGGSGTSGTSDGAAVSDTAGSDSPQPPSFEDIWGQVRHTARNRRAHTEIRHAARNRRVVRNRRAARGPKCGFNDATWLCLSRLPCPPQAPVLGFAFQLFVDTRSLHPSSPFSLAFGSFRAPCNCPPTPLLRPLAIHRCF